MIDILDRRGSEEAPEIQVNMGAPVWLPGRYVEAALPYGDDWLVFLTHGILNEELLDICLVSDGTMIDRASLFDMTGADGVSQIEETGPGRVGFAFPTGTHWRLEVAGTPRLVRPRAGVARDGRLRSRLLLTRA